MERATSRCFSPYSARRFVERAAQQADGLIVQAEARVDGAHRFHERRLGRRLRVSSLSMRAAPLSMISRAVMRVAARFARIGDVEQADHEVRGLLRGLGFGLGAAPRLVRETALVIGEVGEERREDCQRRDADHRAGADAVHAPFARDGSVDESDFLRACSSMP